MKRGLFLLFLVLFSAFVSSRSIDLITSSNYQIEDKNITLLRVYEDKALVCVNGFKTIVTENVIKKVNGVNIELRNTRDSIANFDFDYSCKGSCVCTDDCNNNPCLKESNEIIPEINQIEDGQASNEIIDNLVETGEDEVVTSENIGIGSIIIAALIIIVLFLGVIILWKVY
ncbi:hypothetical protein HYV88_00830 [Candidatus Woesearchaeota archaeon]|nr:hypothetical protein [Candidatus Woesearchaeota archaeon]